MDRHGLPILIVLAVTGTCSPVFAYPPEYAPFKPGKEPRRFKIEECSRSEPRVDDSQGNPARYTFSTGEKAAQQPRVRLESDGDYWSMTVLAGDGQILAGPQRVTDHPTPMTAHYADLNKDSQPDFVIMAPSMGCGLAAENSHLVLAISTGQTYRISTLFTMMPGPEDFVDIDRDDRCEIIQSAFVCNSEDNEKDHKPHNYRVYHLLEIRHGRLTISKKSGLFPRWIWYTFKPNHTPTNRLNAVQKAQLWREQGEIFWKPPQKRHPTF